MSDHLKLWTAVEKTNPSFTKEFNRGGGFKGTAINPTYLARKATETFGPVGIGWGYEIVHEETTKGAKINEDDCEQIHTLRVKVWYKWQGERGELEHFGATTFVGKNKYGSFTDEEYKKKSLTDAIGKCLSLLGFSSDVHLGRYDDNKYVNDLRNEVKKAEAAKVNAATQEEREAAWNEVQSDLQKLNSKAEISALFRGWKAKLNIVNKADEDRLTSLCKARIAQVEPAANEAKAA